MVGLQSVERLFEHLHGEGSVAAVRADFGHQKDFVAPAFQRLAHPIFTFSAMIFPAVVEKGDPVIDGLLNDTYGSLFVLGVAQVVAAQIPARRPAHRACRIFAAEWNRWQPPELRLPALVAVLCLVA